MPNLRVSSIDERAVVAFGKRVREVCEAGDQDEWGLLTAALAHFRRAPRLWDGRLQVPEPLSELNTGLDSHDQLLPTRVPGWGSRGLSCILRQVVQESAAYTYRDRVDRLLSYLRTQAHCDAEMAAQEKVRVAFEELLQVGLGPCDWLRDEGAYVFYANHRRLQGFLETDALALLAQSPTMAPYMRTEFLRLRSFLQLCVLDSYGAFFYQLAT